LYEFLDLKGYWVAEAVNKCREMLVIVEKALNEEDCEPNQGNGVDHVYKIVGHKGNHTQGGIGKIKGAIDQMLKSSKYNYFTDLNHGYFLVRI
jgi:hypothetical protein